jgi:alkylhydroperoxidase family enzyme
MRTQSALAERLGVAPDLLDALFHLDEQSARFTPAQLAAIRYAEIVTTAPADLPTALWLTVQDHFDDDAIVELTAVIGFINYLNRFADALALE